MSVISLQPKQRQLRELLESDSKATAICYGGARGGAKSGGIRRLALYLLGKYPGTSALILRKTFDEVSKNHILPLWQEMPGLRELYKVQDKLLTLPNGSMLHFGYAEHKDDVQRYRGQGFEWIFADDCGAFYPEDLRFLRTVARTTKPGIRPRTVYTPNPGGLAHGYFKRVFVDRKFEDGENPEDFAPLLHAFGWDNVEWVRGELNEAGVTGKEYYGWPEETRREWFLRSNYGRELLAQPKHIQRAHLWGDWTQFAGQFFDCWNYERMTYDPASPPWLADPFAKHSGVAVPEWWQKWIGADQGFAHPFAAYWGAQDPAGVTYVYREWCESGRTSPEVGESLRLMTGSEKISAFYLSPDAFAKRNSVRTMADEIADRIGAIPSPSYADNDRTGGALLLYQLLASGKLLISRSCTKLIDTLPTLIHDPDRTEDVLKVDGDDTYDAFRYLVKTRQRATKVPHLLELQDKLKDVQDPTSRAIFTKRWEKEHRPQTTIAMGARRSRG